MYNDLDPVLHSQLRLAIVSVLMNVEEAEFVYLKSQVNASAGNLSLQLDKLKQAGYIRMRKGHKGNYPVTTIKITPKGLAAMQTYTDAIKKYLGL